MEISEFILTVVKMLLDLSELIASQISNLTAGIVPSEAVDDFAILILLVIIRAGFEYSKKVLEVLIVVLAAYVFLQILPHIIELF